MLAAKALTLRVVDITSSILVADTYGDGFWPDTWSQMVVRERGPVGEIPFFFSDFLSCSLILRVMNRGTCWSIESCTYSLPSESDVEGASYSSVAAPAASPHHASTILRAFSRRLAL